MGARQRIWTQKTSRRKAPGWAPVGTDVPAPTLVPPFIEKSPGTAVDVLPQAARLGSVEQPFPTNIEIGLFSVRVRLIAFS
jgi:hypothetical protein